MKRCPDSQAAQTQDVVGQYYVDYQSLDYYIKTLKDRIEECLQHTACCKRMSGSRLPVQGSGMLPTRCLELCGEQVFLRETGKMCGSYLTLSHRWNQDTEDTRTTTENYEARLIGVWDCTLPKLYTDVLDLAQRVGVKYVWIDSMCIIQAGDEGKDWGQEAVQMAPYYQGSLMTVMASSATKEHGLYPEKMHSPSAVELVRLPYRDREGRRQGHFFVYRNALSGGRQFEASVTSSNLLSRGWVFQEYHLSRRSVYFTPHGMFFECKTQGAINDRNEGTDRYTYFTNAWYEKYLSQYSGLHLTKPAEDRLIALSGVMTEYLESLAKNERERHWKPLTDGEDANAWWRCGLWKFDLPAGLAWQLDTRTKALPERSSKYPSWSWASIIAPVSWDGLVSTGGNMLKNIALVYQNGHPQNRPPEALHVEGRLLPVLVRGHFVSQREVDVVSSLSNSEKATGPDGEAPRSTNWRKICLPENPKLVSGWASIEHADFQDDSVFVLSPVIYALAVSSESIRATPYAYGHLYKASTVFTVLYLRSVLGGKKYQRIGVGKVFGAAAWTTFRSSQERKLVLV